MSIRRQMRRAAAAGARPVALAAILAVLALLLQALAPGMAVAQMARGDGGTRTIVLCTSAGQKTVTLPVDGAPKPMASHSCHDCVMTAAAVVVSSSADSLPVRYVAVARHERAQARPAVLPARPPPRPPSQGPPAVS